MRRLLTAMVDGWYDLLDWLSGSRLAKWFAVGALVVVVAIGLRS
jgi:hypothetical protein